MNKSSSQSNNKILYRDNSGALRVHNKNLAKIHGGTPANKYLSHQYQSEGVQSLGSSPADMNYQRAGAAAPFTPNASSNYNVSNYLDG